MGTNRFSGLYRFSGLFGGDGPSLLNRYITVLRHTRHFIATYYYIKASLCATGRVELTIRISDVTQPLNFPIFNRVAREELLHSNSPKVDPWKQEEVMFL